VAEIVPAQPPQPRSPADHPEALVKLIERQDGSVRVAEHLVENGDAAHLADFAQACGELDVLAQDVRITGPSSGATRCRGATASPGARATGLR